MSALLAKTRGALRPLVPLYAAGTAARNAAYNAGWLSPRQLPAPVISVGNLSAGGSGKTPLVAELVRLLVANKRSPIVLSRGHGRSATQPSRVRPSGTAAEFGDEPLLLARTTGVPVYVAARRHDAGMLAAHDLPMTPQTIFLLDDGMQHRQLARQMEIVAVTAADLTDRPLPAGNLREPLSALGRADVLVFREEDAALAPQFLSRFAHPSCGRPVLWTVRRSLDPAVLAKLPAGPAVAFAGIAHPQDFFMQLRAAGITLPGMLSFADHYRYTFADITRILAALRAANTATLLTTEKDLARLDGNALAALELTSHLFAVPLQTELLQPELCIKQIDTMCGRQS